MIFLATSEVAILKKLANEVRIQKLSIRGPNGGATIELDPLDWDEIAVPVKNLKLKEKSCETDLNSIDDVKNAATVNAIIALEMVHVFQKKINKNFHMQKL